MIWDRGCRSIVRAVFIIAQIYFSNMHSGGSENNVKLVHRAQIFPLYFCFMVNVMCFFSCEIEFWFRLRIFTRLYGELIYVKLKNLGDVKTYEN